MTRQMYDIAMAREIDGKLTVAHAGDTAVTMCRDGADDVQRYVAQLQRDDATVVVWR